METIILKQVRPPQKKIRIQNCMLIEYDDFHLSIMIIFEPYDYKSNNLIIRSHTTFDLSPHLVITDHNSSHCTWVEVIRGYYADYGGNNQENKSVQTWT